MQPILASEGAPYKSSTRSARPPRAPLLLTSGSLAAAGCRHLGRRPRRPGLQTPWPFLALGQATSCASSPRVKLGDGPGRPAATPASVAVLAERPARRLVVLSGDKCWAEREAKEALRRWQEGRTLRTLVADNLRADKPPPVSEWMGQELDAALLFADQQNFLDTFGAVSGALRGGGVLLLCTPPLEQWKQQGGAEMRWVSLLEAVLAAPQSQRFTAFVVEEESQAFDWSRFAPCAMQARGDVTMVPTEEQQVLIEAVLDTRSASPLLVSGRRGRGKSAALGLAAAMLLRRGCEHILVTSPSRESTRQLFEAAFAAASCEGAVVRKEGLGLLHVGQRGVLEFVRPSELLCSDGQARLREAQYLFVDEAAGLPVAEAKQLLERARRVVLATTLDGYEGSGQGFLLRALPVLRESKRDLRHLQLRAPLRWGKGCPLERLADGLLMLDAEPATAEAVQGALPEDVSFEKIDRAELSTEAGAEELERLFGLLRCSHYKTKPSDLQCFLDAPSISWYVLRHKGEVVALGLAGMEEPLQEAAVAEAVYLRKRKAPPQLVAQTLSSEAGFPEATGYRFVRVLRLCVHPAAQRRGLGGLLLEQMIHALRLEEVDALAACFGITPWLLKLWNRAGTRLAWVAHDSNPSSGHHSATVLLPLSHRCGDLLQRVQARLAVMLPELLRGGPLQHLGAETLREIVASLPPLAGCPKDGRAPDPQDVADVCSFAWGARNVTCCSYALIRASLHALRSPEFEFSNKRFLNTVLNLLQGREVNESLLRQAARQLPWARRD